MSQLGKEWHNRAMVGRVAELPSSTEAVPARARPLAVKWSALQAIALPVGLYAFGAALLLFELGSHPSFTYNWENNTADGLFTFMDRPGLDIFHLTQGLMTDSGATPLVVLPAWFGLLVGGESVASMRWPVALIAAAAVPLLWLVGKRLVGKWVALLAALLMALSPAYLLYARTATDVGISLVPMLLTVYVLLRLLDGPHQWWWALALQATLLLGAYGYAPVRFLWPFSVGMMIMEAILRKAQRKRLLLSAALTVVVMAGTITALDYDHEHNFIISVGYYYSGRGEQVANLLASEQDYARTVGQSGDQLPSTLSLLAQTIGQNSADLANLLLDRDTQPALSDYWNPHGRLIPLMLVPFFLLGFGRALWLARRRDAYRYRLLALFFLGFTVPMIFTSQVHIGRLIFAVPLLCLLIAIGVADCALPFADRALRAISTGMRARRMVLGAAVVVLVALVARSTWNEYNIPIPPTKQALITEQLIKDAGTVRAQGGHVALVDVDDPTLVLENIDANQFRLGLQGHYCFYNLTTGQHSPCEPSMPILVVGHLIDRLQTPDQVPGYCTNIYYVAPTLLARFQAAVAAHPDQCPRPLNIKQIQNGTSIAPVTFSPRKYDYIDVDSV
jgi:4-amino-4-deoxy-L-arabinose transferase-like glycosyltransferase